MEFATRTIHAGQPAEPETGAVTAPIFQTTTYQQIAPGEHRGFDYTRTSNPTRARLEAVLADLEGGASAAVFASGLGAEHAVIEAYLKAGDRILVPHDVYGGTFRMLHRVFAPRGCDVAAVDFADLSSVAQAAQSARLVWLETPTNPRLLVYDIAAIAGIAHEAGALPGCPGLAADALPGPPCPRIGGSAAKPLQPTPRRIEVAVGSAEPRSSVASSVPAIDSAPSSVSSVVATCTRSESTQPSRLGTWCSAASALSVPRTRVAAV